MKFNRSPLSGHQSEKNGPATDVHMGTRMLHKVNAMVHKDVHGAGRLRTIMPEVIPQIQVENLLPDLY